MYNLYSRVQGSVIIHVSNYWVVPCEDQIIFIAHLIIFIQMGLQLRLGLGARARARASARPRS